MELANQTKIAELYSDKVQINNIKDYATTRNDFIKTLKESSFSSKANEIRNCLNSIATQKDATIFYNRYINIFDSLKFTLPQDYYIELQNINNTITDAAAKKEAIQTLQDDIEQTNGSMIKEKTESILNLNLNQLNKTKINEIVENNIARLGTTAIEERNTIRKLESYLNSIHDYHLNNWPKDDPSRFGRGIIGAFAFIALNVAIVFSAEFAIIASLALFVIYLVGITFNKGSEVQNLFTVENTIGLAAFLELLIPFFGETSVIALGFISGAGILMGLIGIGMLFRERQIYLKSKEKFEKAFKQIYSINFLVEELAMKVSDEPSFNKEQRQSLKEYIANADFNKTGDLEKLEDLITTDTSSQKESLTNVIKLAYSGSSTIDKNNHKSLNLTSLVKLKTQELSVYKNNQARCKKIINLIDLMEKSEYKKHNKKCLHAINKTIDEIKETNPNNKSALDELDILKKSVLTLSISLSNKQKSNPESYSLITLDIILIIVAISLHIAFLSNPATILAGVLIGVCSISLIKNCFSAAQSLTKDNRTVKSRFNIIPKILLVVMSFYVVHNVLLITFGTALVSGLGVPLFPIIGIFLMLGVYAIVKNIQLSSTKAETTEIENCLSKNIEAPLLADKLEEHVQESNNPNPPVKNQESSEKPDDSDDEGEGEGEGDNEGPKHTKQ